MTKNTPSKKTLKILLSESFTLFYPHRILLAKVIGVFLAVAIFLGKLIRLDSLDEALIYYFGKAYSFVVVATDIVAGFFLYYFCKLFTMPSKKLRKENRFERMMRTYML